MRVLPRLFLLLLLLIGLFSLSPAQAADSFVVKSIHITGLQGISSDTVMSYLPIHVGERINASQSANIISTLYATGFFSDVSLSQEGNTLIIHVAERPVISSISVSGNKDIPKDKLNEVLKKLGLVQGQVFDNSVLQRVKYSLETEYDNIGKYNARVDTIVTPRARGRVNVKIDISEGQTAEVADILIIGNHIYKSSVLIRQMTLATPHLWSFFTHTNLYSQDKLSSSLEALSSYYMDRGYLKFKVDAAQVTLTPDRKHVYLVIHVTEGEVYKVKGYSVVGNTLIPQARLQRMIHIKAGDVFSRKAINSASDAITKMLGNMGYAFASVNVVPEIDDKTKQVYLTFYIQPGNRVYVRRINFHGNYKTEDTVLRHSIRQMEGSLVSVDDIKESEHQLNLTGYLSNVTTDTKAVPGIPDEVDLDYNVTEAPSSQASAGVGYGTDGFVVNAGLNQNNFLGSGKTLGVNFQNSLYSTDYSINYNNPYYTPDGVQRGFTLYAQRITPGNLNISRYNQNTYGGTVNYSIPISANGDNLLLGYGYQNTLLKLGNGPSSQLVNFVNTYHPGGRSTRFNQILLNSGWSRNGLDKATFPTNGLYQDFGFDMTLPGGGSPPLDYYKANYDMNYYYPIIPEEVTGLIFNARASLGYGAGFGPTAGLPFFANYYAGGIAYSGQVRGYESNTLGPLDSLGDALGGNKLATGTLALIFPNPISTDKLRTSVFLDGGNVYSTQAQVRGGSPAGPMRYSTGLSVDWQVPVLNVLLSVSYAKALNPHRHYVNGQIFRDQTEPFQFNVGTSF